MTIVKPTFTNIKNVQFQASTLVRLTESTNELTRKSIVKAIVTLDIC